MADGMEIVINVVGKADTAQIEKVTQQFEGLKGKMEGLGKAGLAGAGVATGAIAGIGGALLSIGGTFDDALDGLRTATGATGPALDALGDSMRNVVGDVPNDIGQVSSVMGELASRTGLAGKPLEDLTKQTLQLANATGGDAQASVEKLTRMLGDASVPTEKQAAALDTVFKASQQTGVGVDRLSSLMVAFGAPMRNLGMSFEESTALLGRFEKEGVNTELVMGALKAASAKWAKEGLAPAEGLKQTIAKIQELGPSAEATALAMETFGQKAGGDMVDTILGGKFAIDELVASIKDSPETIGQAAADTEGFGEKFDKFKNKMMLALEPAGTALLDGLTDAFAKLEPHLPAITEGISKFVGFLVDNPALAAVAGVIGALGGAFGAIMVVLGPFIPIVTGIVGAFGSLGAVVAPLAALFNPVTLAIGAVVAVVVGLKLAWDNNLGGIQVKTAAFVAGVKQFFGDMAAKIGEILTGIGTAITGAWTGFSTTISTFLASIGTAISTAWQSFLDTISTALANIGVAINMQWAAFLRNIQEELDHILKAITDAWEGMTKAIGDALAAIGEAIKTAWDTARETVETALTNIRDNVTGVFQKVREVIDEAMRVVKQVISDVLSHITSLWREWGDFVRGVVDAFAQLIRGDFSGAFETMKRVVQEGIQAVIDFFAGMKDSIMAAIGDASTLLVQVGHDLWAGLLDGLKNSWHLVTDFLSNLLGDLVALAKKILGIGSPSKVFEEIGRQTAEGFGIGFRKTWDNSVIRIVRDSVAKLLGGVGRPVIPDIVSRSLIRGIEFQLEAIIVGLQKVLARRLSYTPGLMEFDAPEMEREGPDIPRKLNQTTRQGRGGFRAGHDWEAWHSFSQRNRAAGLRGPGLERGILDPGLPGFGPPGVGVTGGRGRGGLNVTINPAPMPVTIENHNTTNVVLADQTIQRVYDRAQVLASKKLVMKVAT